MNEASNYTILLVDDEPDILEFISYNLRKEGLTVFTAENGEEGLDLAKEKEPHLIVLDVMMPGMDGIETCEEIRKVPSLKDTIIVFLTARGEDYSQIAGFDAGADDYLMKPIKLKVFISRVKALLKRHRFSKPDHGDFSQRLVRGNLIIDREKYLVTSDSTEFTLPKKEFELLILLASKPERVFTRDEIYASIWGDSIIVGDRTIDVHVRKLREKIGQQQIQTVKGVGYKFVD